MRHNNALLVIALSLMQLVSELSAQQNGNYYQLVLEEVSWDEAVEDCHERGGNLATVTTEAEWNQIKQQLGNSINGLDLWLGGRADPEDNEPNPRKRRWIWVTGETWEYSRWRRLEPDGNFGVQDRLFINGSHSTEGADHKWNDHPNKAVDLAFSKYEIKGYIGEFGWASITGKVHYIGNKTGKYMFPQLVVLLKTMAMKMYSIPGPPLFPHVLLC